MAAEEGVSKITEALHELNVQVIWHGPKIGPFDMSITNAVIYMWLSAIVVFALLLHRQPRA